MRAALIVSTDKLTSKVIAITGYFLPIGLYILRARYLRRYYVWNANVTVLTLIYLLCRAALAAYVDFRRRLSTNGIRVRTKLRGWLSYEINYLNLSGHVDSPSSRSRYMSCSIIIKSIQRVDIETKLDSSL